MKFFFLTPSKDLKNKSIRVYSNLFIPKIIRWINKYFYKYGLIGGILNRYNNSITFYSAVKDKKLYKNYPKDSVFVNFGSGAFSHNKWINYDLPGQSKYYKKILGKKNIDYFPIDLCQDNLILPLEDQHVQLIYCSHTLEHIEESKGLRFLKECYRILKKGGVLRVSLPNTDNNFFFCKTIFFQDNISKEIKNEIMLNAAEEVLSETKKIPKEVIIEEIIRSNFITSVFVTNIIKKFKNIGKFDVNNPGRHITYYSHCKNLKIAQDLGFKYFPTYKGNSLVEPFKNRDVFDTTEPQWSIYGEFLK